MFLIGITRITPLKVVVLRERVRNNGSNCQLVNMSPAVKGTVGTVDSPYLEASRKVEKSSSYREFELSGTRRKKPGVRKKKQFLLHSEHFNHG